KGIEPKTMALETFEDNPALHLHKKKGWD
ncbi:hypothetical protein MNBD_DELTA02-473, partial [hydrothermal vent metagenome]